MSKTKDSNRERAAGAQVDLRRQGRVVALDLGWPRNEVGLIGAFGGLLNKLAEPLQAPRSSKHRVEVLRKESDSAVRLAVSKDLGRIIAGKRPSRHELRFSSVHFEHFEIGDDGRVEARDVSGE